MQYTRVKMFVFTRRFLTHSIFYIEYIYIPQKLNKITIHTTQRKKETVGVTSVTTDD